MRQMPNSLRQGRRLVARSTEVLLTAAAVVIAASATAAAASGAAARATDRTGVRAFGDISSLESPTGLGRLGRPVAGVLDLRDPLPASFTSIELGAPPSVPVGANPSGIAINDATHTVYVVNQTDDTVSVIDARACNARRRSGCGGALATINLGAGGLQNGPVSAVVSPDGETLYVASAFDASPLETNVVEVINAASCNAMRTSGCGAGAVASVATGNGPLAMAEDPDSDTLYVANSADNTVSLIDGRTCNAQRMTGCGEIAPTVPVGTAPLAVAVDPQTHTVYVANVDDNTVSVIDAEHCNAEYTAGCPTSPPPVQAVGGAPAAIAVSPDGETVYVADSGVNFEGAFVPGGNTVSVLDAGACNGGHPAGCTSVPPPVVAVGGQQDNQPQSLVVDPQTQDVYAADSFDDTVSVIDGSRCNARHLSGCAQPAPSEQMGAEPNALAADPNARTIYVTDAADNGVAVIDDRACNDQTRIGCRPAPAPAAPLAPSDALTLAAVDVAEHTAYVEDDGVNFGGTYSLDLIDTRTCNARDTAGCNPQPPLPTVPIGGFAGDIVVDQSTNTVYVDGGGNDLEVIDAATCNATNTSCANTAVVPLGTNNGGGPIAIDQATQTVYVGGAADIAVVDARHCNAEDLSGCATQTPVTFSVAPSPNALAATPDTLYDAEVTSESAPSDVDVIDTRHCQAADMSDCASQPASHVQVGVIPGDTAVDLAHNTLYVPDNGNGDIAGELSMINTTHCNGDDTNDCTTQTPPTTPLPRGPASATLDPFTGTLYVTNINDASVSLINTATCNATRLAGCPRVPREVVVGSGPEYTGLDPAHQTLYVPNFLDGTVSLVGTGH